ncbi:MAG: MerR family transcriptional regulator [Ruminococcaceae bacterium]|nr:MerR family transcriptional regulator [Oscillospiraceae bacterium]
MIKIGDLAKICNVSTQTLRYYDSEGVLKADVISQSSGYRFYSTEAVEKYKQILFYKNLGFSLDEIKKIQVAKSDELRDILQKKKDELSCSIDKFKNQIKIINEICENGLKKPVLSEILLLPFENDPQVVGKWQLCGKLLDENELTSLKKVNAGIADEEIIFMPGGAFAWKYFWTKGILYRLSPKYKFAIPNSYRTVEQDGTRYIIMQFMSDDCIDKGVDSVTLLYRQIDTVAYTEQKIRRNIDKTELPFVEDKSVQGEWTALDLVPDISKFSPNKRYSNDKNIYVININFLPRGICTRRIRTMSRSSNLMLRYTKGFVLDDKEMTAEEYQIKVIDGEEFLFVQHKSGDYFYGGMMPHWYVFKRKEKII